MEMLYAIASVGAGAIALFWLGVSNIRVVRQYERGVVFRLGRVRDKVRQPGLTMLIPVVDRLQKVNMQIITMPIPAQDGITRDNVTVRVDAVIYFKVIDPVRAVVDVQDYMSAIGQVAQTSLRSIIGKSNLDDLLSNRERLNQGLELLIDNPAVGWGIHIDRVEIKDVVLPDSMKRSIARQAEAERERRARVITADGELQASEKLAAAADVMAAEPAALQLRLLETVVEVAAEKNSTVVLPFPVELLRFLERVTPRHPPTVQRVGNPQREIHPQPAGADGPRARNRRDPHLPSRAWEPICRWSGSAACVAAGRAAGMIRMPRMWTGQTATPRPRARCRDGCPTRHRGTARGGWLPCVPIPAAPERWPWPASGCSRSWSPYSP